MLVNRLSALLCTAMASICCAKADVPLRLEIAPGAVSINSAARSALQSIKDDEDISIVLPVEVAAAIESLKACTVELPKWNKAEFLKDFAERQTQIGATAKLLSKELSPFVSVKRPLVNASAFSQTRGGSSLVAITPEAFLKVVKERGIKAGVVEVHGIPGKPISDPAALDDSGLISKADIETSLSKFVEAAATGLFGWFSSTPSGCYSSEQLRFLSDRLKDTFKPALAISNLLPATAELVDIECANGKSYSRFKAPIEELPEVVKRARKDGPWPFGPAGMYFKRSWFVRGAVWQMYARESVAYLANLSVDVADYYCGPP